MIPIRKGMMENELTPFQAKLIIFLKLYWDRPWILSPDWYGTTREEKPIHSVNPLKNNPSSLNRSNS